MEIPWNFCVKKPWGISVREDQWERSKKKELEKIP